MKLVIVGGVAGGASAAARARRLNEEAEIILLQSGPDVSYASCGMPYYIGKEITDRAKMAVQTPQSLREKMNLDVRVNARVVKIDTGAKNLQVKNDKSGEEYEINYDELVLAVGAEPFKPPIKGIDRPGLFSLRSLEDMDGIFQWIQRVKECNGEKFHAVVAGAGFIGLEMVEQLERVGAHVTLVELMPQVLGPLDLEMAAVVQQEIEEKGVRVITGDAIAEFVAEEGGKAKAGGVERTVAKLKSGIELPAADLTILGLGVRPDTRIVKEAGIACGPRGHILVDDHLKTNVANVWAVGDAVEVRNPILGGDEKWSVPLAGPANRQGRMVADNIHGKNRSFKGTWAASVVRVHSLIVACVGLNEKFLKAKTLPYEVVNIHVASHAGYYPGAKFIRFKLIFCPKSGKIYGAQAIGEDGVEKRIDVVSTAMQGNMTVEDLAEVELCYAPPVGSAKDPVNIAGMVAQNIMDGLVSNVSWEQFQEDVAKDDSFFVLDVRGGGEIESNGTLSGKVVNIPLPELRSRTDEVPKDKKVVISCASGQRAYYASRILSQRGYDDVKILSGAFKTYAPIHEMANRTNSVHSQEREKQNTPLVS